MAIDGHGLTIKVDPSGFDKFVAETVNKSIQESLDNMALGMIDMSKKLSFDGKAYGTAEYDPVFNKTGEASPGPGEWGYIDDPQPLSMDNVRAEVVAKLEAEPKPRASLVEVDNG